MAPALEEGVGRAEADVTTTTLDRCSDEGRGEGVEVDDVIGLMFAEEEAMLLFEIIFTPEEEKRA